MRRREKGKGSITKTPSGKFKGAIYVTDINGKRLTENIDYTVSYNTTNFIDAGEIEVTIIGQKANLLDNDKKYYKFIQLDSPILSDVDLEKISKINSQSLRAVKIPMLFRSPGTGEDLVEALDLLCQRAKDAILEGYNVIILSDRNINKQQAPIPALLATSALQHYLINN